MKIMPLRARWSSTRGTPGKRPDLDQLQLQAGQRPLGHFLGQFDTAQEGGLVVGRRVQLQPDLIVAEFFA